MMYNKELFVLIIGTNKFDNYSFFEEKCYEKLGKYFEQNYKITIREQEVNITDGFAVKFAKENNCNLERYKIQWDLLGKGAGLENIKKLIWGKEGNIGADLLLCFESKWDKEKDKYLINKLIMEFKSIISLEFFDNKNYFSFVF